MQNLAPEDYAITSPTSKCLAFSRKQSESPAFVGVDDCTKCHQIHPFFCGRVRCLLRAVLIFTYSIHLETVQAIFW